MWYVCMSIPQAPVEFVTNIKSIDVLIKFLKKSILTLISIIDINSLHQGDNRFPKFLILTLICKEQGEKWLSIFLLFCIFRWKKIVKNVKEDFKIYFNPDKYQ